jgi:lipopolysaccharide transport system ATP-binding protein
MIDVSSISKTYKVYARPIDRFREVFSSYKRHTTNTVLKDISFNVEEGSTLGIIGRNGAGKSTLLKVLNGVVIPDTGEVSVDGRIAGLLELGTGFNPELSGLDNIYMNGLLLGMSKDEIRAKLTTIIDFSELSDVINRPIKTYSSGMVMRLAFSTGIHSDPACFLIDEALSVGDAHFQQKCFRKIKEFKSSGGTIIFVSHDMNAVKVLCDKVLLLEEGYIVASGNPDDMVNQYNYLITNTDNSVDADIRDAEGAISYGNFAAKIIEVNIIAVESGGQVVNAGGLIEVNVKLSSDREISNLNIGILLRNNFGQDVFGTNTWKKSVDLSIQKSETWVLQFLIRVDLAPGDYTVTAALATGDTHLDGCVEWQDHSASFEVISADVNDFVGMCNLKTTIEKHLVHES